LRVRILGSFLGAIGLLNSSSTQILAFGGPGGSPYRLTCQSGILVGLVARYGNWIDALALACRGINADGSLGTQYQTRSVGGTGGTSKVHLCPDGSVVAGLGGVYGLFVNSLLLRCQRWDASTRSIVRTGGSVIQVLGTLSAPNEAERKVCSEGQVGVGVAGKAGIYVDSVDLVCASP
jgi:hypothetical protein